MPERMEEQLRIQTFPDLTKEEVEALEKAGDEKPFIIEQRQANNSGYVTMPDPFE
jgi:diketogulonate reductase-like aldo/keto reductase